VFSRRVNGPKSCPGVWLCGANFKNSVTAVAKAGQICALRVAVELLLDSFDKLADLLAVVTSPTVAISASPWGRQLRKNRDEAS
jgi:hypothetical protein